jgi:hypothetical protein
LPFAVLAGGSSRGIGVGVAPVTPTAASSSGVIAWCVPLGVPQFVQNLSPWIDRPHPPQKFAVACSPTALSSFKFPLSDALPGRAHLVVQVRLYEC